MAKTPFIYKFAAKLNECEVTEEQSHYDPKLQMNLLDDGTLSWSAVTRRLYTNAYTSGHTVPAHRTPSNKWVPARVVKGKYDRRAGK